MSDYYYEIIGKTRHAELAEQARQDGLVKSLPHRPGPLARLWARVTRPTQPVVSTQPGAGTQPVVSTPPVVPTQPVVSPQTTARRHANASRQA